MIINTITATRQQICAAVQRVRREFIPESLTIETDIAQYVVLCVEILPLASPDGYAEIELVSVDVFKNTLRRACCLPNIAEAIGRKLDKAVERFNNF